VAKTLANTGHPFQYASSMSDVADPVSTLHIESCLNELSVP